MYSSSKDGQSQLLSHTKAKTTQQIKLAGKNMAAQITPCTKKSKETFRRCINGDIWNNLCSK